MFTKLLLNGIVLAATVSLLANHQAYLYELREPTILMYGLTSGVTPPDPALIVLSTAYAASIYNAQPKHAVGAIAFAALALNKLNTNTLFEVWGILPKINVGLDNPLAAIHPPTLIVGSLVYATSCLTDLSYIAHFPKLQKLQRHSKLKYLIIICVSLALSCWWANQELFWGSYWNWDPVETGALVGLLVLLSYEHSRLCKKTSSLWKRLLCAALVGPTIFFLNKTSVAQSVHAFSQGPLNNLGAFTSLCVVISLSYSLVTAIKWLLAESQGPLWYLWATAKLLSTVIIVHILASVVGAPEGAVLHTSRALLAWAALAHTGVALFFLHPPAVWGKTYGLKKLPLGHAPLLLLIPLLFAWPTLTESMYLDSAWPFKTLQPSLAVGEYRAVLATAPNNTAVIYNNSPYTHKIKFKHFITQPTAAINNNWVSNYFTKPNNPNHFLLLKDNLL